MSDQASAVTSPLPWRWLRADGEIVHDADDRGARAIAWSDADYEFVVRAVNSHHELLACLRRMCGMYGAYDRRLAPLLAEADGTVWTFERANSLALEAIAKAQG